MPSEFDRLAFQSRLRQLRLTLYGADGAADLAGKLGIPPESWGAYERGAVMPDSTLLSLIRLTGVDPAWLLTGVE